MIKGALLIGTLGGFVGGIISALAPSLPTSYWMWKERPAYRPILLGAWILAIVIIIIVILFMVR